jgi:hypothetical protein
MRHDLFVLSFGLGAMLLAGHRALAETPATCAPHDVVERQLQRRYGETRQMIALAGPQVLVELYASRQGGTWTLTVTSPDGTSCLAGSGDAYEALGKTAAAPGEPS